MSSYNTCKFRVIRVASANDVAGFVLRTPPSTQMRMQRDRFFRRYPSGFFTAAEIDALWNTVFQRELCDLCRVKNMSLR